jgi:hypothetical protein
METGFTVVKAMWRLVATRPVKKANSQPDNTTPVERRKGLLMPQMINHQVVAMAGTWLSKLK